LIKQKYTLYNKNRELPKAPKPSNHKSLPLRLLNRKPLNFKLLDINV